MTNRTRPWLVLAGCFLLSVGVNAFVIAPSSIAPLFAERFGVAPTAAGELVSAAIVGSILVQIPGGYLLDRYDYRWLVVPAVGLYVLVALAIQTVDTFTALLGLALMVATPLVRALPAFVLLLAAAAFAAPGVFGALALVPVPEPGVSTREPPDGTEPEA